MTREQIIELITQVVGDELTLMRTEVERLVAAKPLPPFTPPPIWAAGRTSASVVVRHVNGLFMARRDTEAEPPGEDWLPLVVGVAEIKAQIDGRNVSIATRLSDGRFELVAHKLAVPIVRGYWSADVDYEPGDRVFRFGEFHALEASKGIEPGSEGSDVVWLKVGGKHKSPTPPPQLAFALDDDGNMTESGRVVGSIKPLVRELLTDLVNKHGK
jgi:hypothetical protein